METEKAAAVFTDPPYNVKIDGHVCGKAAIKHREFAMASGEMTEPEFADFLTKALKLDLRPHRAGRPDLRLHGLAAYGRDARRRPRRGIDLLNLCVWAKTNGGMGSLYRSRHELVFVFRNGKEPHLNNVQLGRFGRNRDQRLELPRRQRFRAQGPKDALALHPTVKPIALVSDAILDCTKRNDIVLDPFFGSGTTILAAERTGRRCFGIEIDPIYVDTAIERWERMTGRKAQNGQGLTFEQVKLERSAGQ